MQLAVDGIVERLRGVPPPSFIPGEVCSRLEDVLLDPASLTPYLLFQERRYTRNLIYRDSLFELIALCWDPPPETPIHTPPGQLGWLPPQPGALRRKNFHPRAGPGPGSPIPLVPNGGIERAPAGMLDLQQGEDGIHRVSNPFDERA